MKKYEIHKIRQMKQINETERRKKEGKNHNSKLKIEEIHYCIYINPSFLYVLLTADCSMAIIYHRIYKILTYALHYYSRR